MENEAIQALSLADNETVQAIALMLGAAWAAGINLYAAVLVLGILGNAGYADLPPALQVLQDPLVIGVAGIMYFIEFFADKTPGVDSGWDAIHTFIRIPAGAVMAAGAAQGLEVNQALELAAALIGGRENDTLIGLDGDDATMDALAENPEVIACDTVVLCAGQLSERGLADELAARGQTCHVIGGADVAAELDAKRAIDQGSRLAAGL